MKVGGNCVKSREEDRRTSSLGDLIFFFPTKRREGERKRGKKKVLHVQLTVDHRSALSNSASIPSPS